VIYVTHDQVEAMTLGTRIAILNQGVLQQIATPQTLYSAPKNKFVAGFIGSPAMNFFDGALVEMADQLWFKAEALTLALLPTALAQYRRYVGQRVICGLRPEDIHDPRYIPPGTVTTPLKGIISHTESMGHEIIVYPTLGDGQTYAARVDRRSTLAPGDSVELAVAIAAPHFFDPHTEAALTTAVDGP
jgi:multiple sugar transport system ATP-binding protein